MIFEKCPLCEKIKEEKLKIYNNIKDFSFPLCKEHIYEIYKLRNLAFDNFERKEGKCFFCSLEEEIEKSFLENFRDYDRLCLFHLKRVIDRLQEEDIQKILNKWKEFDKYLKELIESYDYRKESIASNCFYLILDHLLGTGRRI